RVRHELTRLPSTRTVQAPHCPWSQPFFVPVKLRYSRNRSSKVVHGATSIRFSTPLTFSLIELFAGLETGTFPTIFPSDVLFICLAPGCENGSKSRLTAHHAIVGLGRPLQRKDLGHNPHSGGRAEGERILRIDGRAGGPAHDRPPRSDEQTR